MGRISFKKNLVDKTMRHKQNERWTDDQTEGQTQFNIRQFYL